MRLNAPAGGTLDEVRVTVVDDTTGSADDPADYSYSTQVLIFPSGTSTATQTVSMTIAQDLISESDETIDLSFSITLGTADLGAITAHQATIVDDEGAPVVNIANASVTEGPTADIGVRGEPQW